MLQKWIERLSERERERKKEREGKLKKLSSKVRGCTSVISTVSSNCFEALSSIHRFRKQIHFWPHSQLPSFPFSHFGLVHNGHKMSRTTLSLFIIPWLLGSNLFCENWAFQFVLPTHVLSVHKKINYSMFTAFGGDN